MSATTPVARKEEKLENIYPISIQQTELQPGKSTQTSVSVPLLSPQESLSPLCGICSAIDFGHAFRPGPWTSTRDVGEFVSVLGTISKSSTCRLCQFFAKMVPDVGLRALNSGKFHLRALSAARCFGAVREVDGSTNSVVLAIFPGLKMGYDGPHLKNAWSWIDKLQKKGYICLETTKHPELHTGFFGRRLCPDRIDYDLIKSRLRFCSDNHSCRRFTNTIPGFRVVDCNSREIVYAPARCLYVALSYVWGSEQSSHTYSEREDVGSGLLSSAPRVVQNALEVTTRLGYKYLWIDRYCIDQNNIQEKHIQISHMDGIYIGAALTIIAAAGEDPSFGLSGVGHNTRPEQPWVEVGGQNLVSSLINPRLEMKDSKWMTRGWTYQEGLLSGSRLVFTPSQVYFQCRAMHCIESVVMPLKALHTRVRYFHENMTKCRVFPHSDVAGEPAKFTMRVAEYSSRKLSFPEDILKAFLGVLKQFQNGPWPTYQMWGLPILREKNMLPKLSPFHCKQFAQSLFWRTRKYARAHRREGLPSWSWVGWDDFTNFQLDYLQMQGSHSTSVTGDEYLYDIKVSIEVAFGELVPWTFDATGIPPEDQSFEELSPFIHVWGWSLTLRLDLRTFRIIAPIQISLSNPELDITIDLEDLASLKEHENTEISLQGLMLGYYRPRWQDYNSEDRVFFKFLVLYKEKEHFCRFGVMKLESKTLFGVQRSESPLWGRPGDLRVERRHFKIG